MSRPNLSNYGTHGESAFPGYWDRVLRAWSPVLGQTGGRIYDFSRNNRWGITTGINLSTQWGTFRENTGLSHDGVDDWVDFGSNDFSGTDFSVVSWFRILTAGTHFPYSTSSGAGTLGIELLYGTGFNFSQIASRIASSPSLIHDFGSTAAALADIICFVQTYTDAQPTKTHQIFVNGANNQSATFAPNQLASTQNWSWAKRGTTFFAAGGGGAITNGTCQWFEQMVFRGIITANEAAELYRLGPGGLYQRRRRRYSFELVSGGAQTITANLLNNSNTFYNATVTQSTVGAPQTITASFFTNTNTFYNAIVTPGAVTVSANLLFNTNTFYNATVTAGAVNISANLLTNTSTFYDATISSGTANIDANLLTNTSTFYNATVTAGAVTISADLLSNANTFYNAVVSIGDTIVADLYTNNSTIYNAIITAGAVNISANLLTNTATIYLPTVTQLVDTIVADRLNNTSIIYLPTLTGGSTAPTDTSDILTKVSDKRKRRKLQQQLEEENIAAQILKSRQGKQQKAEEPKKAFEIKIKTKQEEVVLATPEIEKPATVELSQEQVQDIQNAVTQFKIKQNNNKKIQTLLFLASTLDD